MIESKLKVKNENSGQLFRSLCRTTSVKTVVYKVLAGNDDPSELKFESPPIDNSRVTITQ